MISSADQTHRSLKEVFGCTSLYEYLVFPENADVRAIIEIPDSDGFIVGAGDDLVRVGHDNREDIVRMSLEFSEQGSALKVPDLDGPFFLHVLALRTESP